MGQSIVTGMLGNMAGDMAMKAAAQSSLGPGGLMGQMTSNLGGTLGAAQAIPGSFGNMFSEGFSKASMKNFADTVGGFNTARDKLQNTLPEFRKGLMDNFLTDPEEERRRKTALQMAMGIDTMTPDSAQAFLDLFDSKIGR